MQYTDYSKVLSLAKAILVEDKRMLLLIHGLQESLKQLSPAFRDDGYHEVEAYATNLMKTMSDAQKYFFVVSQEFLTFADYLKAAKGDQQEAPGAAGYSNPYVKSIFSGTVAYTDPQTKQRVEKMSTRIVHQNKNMDPTMVIPAGTPYANGKTVPHDTTNLQLMEEGKAPFIAVTDSDGNRRLVPVELHHLSGAETQKGSAYFTGTARDGSLVEIAASVHDMYDRQLHIGNPSFRRNGDGQKSDDAAKYDNFRKQYWKFRAQQFKSGQGNPHTQ